jgi:hypothetical protein
VIDVVLQRLEREKAEVMQELQRARSEASMSVSETGERHAQCVGRLCDDNPLPIYIRACCLSVSYCLVCCRPTHACGCGPSICACADSSPRVCLSNRELRDREERIESLQSELQVRGLELTRVTNERNFAFDERDMYSKQAGVLKCVTSAA